MTSQRKLSEALAEANVESAELLMERLSEEAEAVGASHAEIAELVGTDEESIRAALSRSIDVTLSDVQMIALAIGAHVGYIVTPAVDRLLDRISSDAALKTAVETWRKPEFSAFAPASRHALRSKVAREVTRDTALARG